MRATADQQHLIVFQSFDYKPNSTTTTVRQEGKAHVAKFKIQAEMEL